MKKYAIIGFGCAGYHAARAIRQRDRAAVIDVYSDTDTAPGNPMLTTYYVKGAIPWEAMFPFGSLEEIASELELDCHMNCPVVGLEPETKTLRLADGTRRQYDGVVIATGASAVMPPIPGLELPGVFKMRTVEDAAVLKSALDAGAVNSGLVIGASWVGIKVVEDLVERAIPCTLVDGAPWMFSVAAFEETARRAERDLTQKGVKVSCGQMLDHIEQEPNGQLTAVMKTGDRFTADTVAVCIGVRTNTGFLRDSGIAMGRGITVDSRMGTNFEGIYAAGDCCEALDIQSGTHRNIGVWANAGNQGDVAGANVAGGHEEFDANVLVNLAHYLDYDLISMGDPSLCTPDDTVYEYEDESLYIRAVRDGSRIKCINMIGSADVNGVVKHAFIKTIKNPEAALDLRTVCLFKGKGFPDGFINFLGGNSLD